MTGFPLPPGTHHLKAKVTVSDDDYVIIEVRDQDSVLLMWSSNPASALKGAVLMVTPFLDIKFAG